MNLSDRQFKKYRLKEVMIIKPEEQEGLIEGKNINCREDKMARKNGMRKM